MRNLVPEHRSDVSVGAHVFEEPSGHPDDALVMAIRIYDFLIHNHVDSQVNAAIHRTPPNPLQKATSSTKTKTRFVVAHAGRGDEMTGDAAHPDGLGVIRREHMAGRALVDGAIASVR
jgi:hypothetical protein